MSRYAVEVTLTWIGVALYIGATVLQSASVVFGRPRWFRTGLALAVLGLVPHGAAILLRWVAVGHGPYMLKYEVLSSNAWVVIAVLSAVLLRRTGWAALAVVVMPLAILSVALGMFSNPETRDLPPALRSMWLVFHVIFAKISAAAFMLSLGAAVLQLFSLRERPPAWVARIPPPPALDALVVRAVGFGFVFWTITMAAGAIWGNQSWGRYWGWDPIETWSLVSWLTWGSFLHARLFFKPKARTTAWLAISAFAIFVLAWLILPFFIASLHASYFT
jgi:cytochrome c-type biogenesis protein CcsB